MRSTALASIVAVLALSVGCLGRTGIGVEELDVDDQEDAATDTGLSLVDAAPDTAPLVDSSTPDARRDVYIDIWEVFPIPDSGPLGACASCVRDKCGAQVNECINSPECRSGLACTVTRCLAGGGGGGGGPGGFDLKCVTDCFGGDLGKAFKAISTFTCIMSNCNTACGGVFGGIPGFPGGGGGGGGSGGGSGGFAFTPEDMSRWPMSTKFRVAPEAFAPWRCELQKSACEQGLTSCER